MLSAPGFKNFIRNLLKLARRFLVVFIFISALLLFLNEKILIKIGIHEITQNNRSVIGLVFICSVVIFTIGILSDALASIQKRRTIIKINRREAQRLNCLTEEEKKILRFYIYRKTRTNYLHFDDRVVQGLLSEGVIHLSSPAGSMLSAYAFNISHFAWEYLNTHPNLLIGTTHLVRTDGNPTVGTTSDSIRPE
jgi:hypothetical protein